MNKLLQLLLKKQLDIDLTDREKFSASRQEIEFKLEETVRQLTESQEESLIILLYKVYRSLGCMTK